MNEKLRTWTVETLDLTARVAAAIAPSPVEDELRLLRLEVERLRVSTTLLADEVARLRLAAPVRRILPYAPTERLARLS